MTATVAAEMTELARDLLASLAAESRAQAMFAYDDPRRQTWDGSPRPRPGLTLAAMAGEQRLRAPALLASALSRRGYATALAIMSLERVLFAEENSSPQRDPERYYLSFFATPGDATWGWRWEGHHLALNVSVTGGRVVAAPLFMAANPVRVRNGPRAGLRVLAVEEEAGRALVTALNPGSRAAAVISPNAPPPPDVGAGLAADDMDARARTLLHELIQAYTGRLRDELANDLQARIDHVGIGSVRFAWAGGDAVGEAHWYRIKGPTFSVEYDHTQNGANHIHSLWQDG